MRFFFTGDLGIAALLNFPSGFPARSLRRLVPLPPAFAVKRKPGVTLGRAAFVAEAFGPDPFPAFSVVTAAREVSTCRPD